MDLPLHVDLQDPDHAVHLTRRRLLERLEPDEVTMVDEEPYS